MAQPHEVRLASGRRIDWHNPPKPNTICSWTKKTSGGKKIKASFRTIAHLNYLNNLALKKFDEQLVVIQPPFNTTVPASAGTHDKDAVWDVHIPGVGWWDQQRFFRSHGFGCWYRHPPQFGNHIHGFTLPPNHGGPFADDFKQLGTPVGKYVDGGISLLGHAITSSQLSDYWNHAYGLSGRHTKGSDKSWFPADIRKTIFDLDGYVERRAK